MFARRDPADEKKTSLEERTLNKTDRLFALLILIQGKPNMTTRHLAEHFGVSRRTIFRDLQSLERSGVPLTYAEDSGGYEILEGYQLPPLMLTGREAAVLLLGTNFVKLQTDASLKKDADEVSVKIKSILPQGIREYIDRILNRTVLDPYWLNTVTHAREDDEDTGKWVKISEAIAHRNPIFVRYHVASRDETTRRRIDPLGIIYYSDHWTLVGYCHLRKDIRSFRLDQMEEVYPMSERFSSHADFDLQAYLEEKGLGRRRRIVLRFHKKIYSHARRRIPARIEEERTNETDKTVTFYFENLDYIANWLLQFGTSVRIDEPTELREKLGQLLGQMQDVLQESVPLT
ncbi:MAG: YafY family transcriptional regulator [Bacteroidetes Order II. Incertae sedis bacterium]|nr:YafY family transcriptional regulator [Bacteroidetes Order II. bacterium]